MEQGKDVGGITLNGDLACSMATHPKCVAVGTCQGSCLWKSH